MSTPVVERPVIRQRTLITEDDFLPYEEPKDPNAKAHIVNPPMNLHIWLPGMEAQDVVSIARLHGIRITALCGYEFVPKHNPDKLDACEACIKIAGEIMAGAGE